MPRYRLRKIYEHFDTTTAELSYIVGCLAVRRQDLERDIHIEGCFLKFVVSWEAFLEEHFLRCMCTARTRSGNVIKPKISPFRDTDKAFKRLNIHRKPRQKDFTDWLSHDILKQRSQDFFHHRSRIHRIWEAPDKLDALVTIRNAITHGPQSSLNKFKRYVVNSHGYLTHMDPTIAQLLVTKARRTSRLIFDELTSYFRALADALTN